MLSIVDANPPEDGNHTHDYLCGLHVGQRMIASGGLKAGNPGIYAVRMPTRHSLGHQAN